ncbi:hypothetical protein D0Z07_6668 [Hyphodiscus hymeniophilus]|uniref:Uncharacterized protein n=1 Tax=Hyphodiscus hymeniophilus TaxID=353542 RepID=A0A9P6VGQ4_9HELO|nr:hypothetical protein D0Z07_6668 [Hyphodiscus hymeniophilus]
MFVNGINKIMLYPYYAILWGGFAGCVEGWSWFEETMSSGLIGITGSMYMMSRMVLGHKTWFGKG